MLSFEGSAEIKGMKIDRGASDDADVILTIKVLAECVSADAAARVLGADNGAQVLEHLFWERSRDDGQGARFAGIQWISCAQKYENALMLQIEDLPEVRTSLVYGIKVKPRNAGQFDMQLTATVHTPPSELIDGLPNLLKSHAAIVIRQDPELDLKGGSNKGESYVDEQARKSREALDKVASDMERNAKPPRKSKGQPETTH